MLEVNEDATQSEKLGINLEWKLRNNMLLTTESQMLRMNENIVRNKKLKIKSKNSKNNNLIIHSIQLT